MRIVIFSIAFLFLALSAQSQVLKSAGVWYFLDVDSMTARPAVLPNGTELAYVVGTKTVYYWNRNTSTWTAYGSTFGRDSIYFDASIAGSGTVSDPWGVDSTLFATISGVGDSIAAAVANYFPLQGGTLTGTGGAGFIGLPSQVTAPGTPASGLNIFAQGSSFNWKGVDGYERLFASTLTGGRTYTLPDVSGTFAFGTGTADRSARWSATNTLAAGNMTDNGTKLQALLPWQFQSYTTAGLPTGVTGYNVYNSTLADQIYYNTSDWYYTTPWKQSTNSSNVFLNSGTAIVNTSSVINSNYKFQVNGGALYSGATFTTNLTNQAALDIVSSSITAQSGTTHSAWGLNIEGSVTLNTANQTYGGLRIATTSNATSAHFVKPLDIVVSAATLGSSRIVNTNASGSAEWLVGGAGGSSTVNPPERTVMRSPNGGNSSSSMPGYNYLSTSGAFGWAITGANKSMLIHSNVSSIVVAAVDPTFHLRDNKVLIGRRAATTPTATLEITGEGTTSSTTAFLVQNSGRANNAFRILNNGLVGVGLSTPLEELDVNGDLRVRDSTDLDITPAHSSITGLLTRDATGWIGLSTFGADLKYSAGVLGLKRKTLIDSLPIADVTINGAASSDFRIQNTRVQFDGKFKVGPDSSFVHNPAADTTYIQGNTRVKAGNLTIEKVSGTPYLNILASASSGNQEAGIYLRSRENFSPVIEFDSRSSTSAGKQLAFYNYNTANSGSQVFTMGSEPGRFGARSIGRFSVWDTLNLTRKFSFFSNGTGVFDSYGAGAKEAADLSKTESVYNAIYATDGTLLEKRANTEQYNTITSTTSPVTLSSTIADNLINQGSTQATFTLNMPASPMDGQIVMITYNNAITTLTIDGNGNTIVGSAVTTAVAGSQRKFKFYTGIGWIKQY